MMNIVEEYVWISITISFKFPVMGQTSAPVHLYKIKLILVALSSHHTQPVFVQLPSLRTFARPLGITYAESLSVFVSVPG